MVQNIRGEMTVLETFQQNFSLKDSIFVKTIASALKISTSKVRMSICYVFTCFFSVCKCVYVFAVNLIILLQEIHLLRRHMFPPLMCMAAAEGDNDTLENLRKQVWLLLHVSGH